MHPSTFSIPFSRVSADRPRSAQVDSIPRVLPDGSLNTIPAVFFLSYIVLVNWILVQAREREKGSEK